MDIDKVLAIGWSWDGCMACSRVFLRMGSCVPRPAKRGKREKEEITQKRPDRARPSGRYHPFPWCIVSFFLLSNLHATFFALRFLFSPVGSSFLVSTPGPWRPFTIPGVVKLLPSGHGRHAARALIVRLHLEVPGFDTALTWSHQKLAQLSPWASL